MKLDIGCGPNKRPGYFGLDSTRHEGVDMVHDLEITPWPLDSLTFEAINASHVLEHLNPRMLMRVMNDAWRVLEVGGTMDIRTPYGAAYAFDPTHCILFQESSFLYFDPSTPYHAIYKPMPWEIIFSKRNPLDLELRTILKKKDLP